MRETVKARDEHIAALDRLVGQQAALIDLWRTAAESRKEANTIDAKIEALYRESVEAYKAEVARVRAERDAERRAKFRWGAVGLVLGVVVGVLAGRR